MKNQYVGDIGDYGKFGLLRFLAKKGIKIGVNWYLTPNDNSDHGKKTEYLEDEKFRVYDSTLYELLGAIANNQDKTVLILENNNVIPNAVYYHEIVDANDRDTWHKAGVKCLSDIELIFCDPDNGILGKKSITSKNADKYISPLEITDYYNQGQNVVYYCHKARRTDAEWLQAKLIMTKYLQDAKIYIFTFHRVVQRSYIFVLHPEDFPRYKQIFDEFENSEWVKNGVFTREYPE